MMDTAGLAMRGGYVDDEGVRWLSRSYEVGRAPAPRGGRMALLGAAAFAMLCLSAQPPGPSASIGGAHPASLDAANGASVPVAVSSASHGILPIPPVPSGIWAMGTLPMPFDALTGAGTGDLEAAAAERPGRDPDEILRFGPMRVLLMAIADKESSFAPSVKAKTSSAEGLYQFIDRTWFKVIRTHGPSHGHAEDAALVQPDADGYLDVADAKERVRILSLRRDPYLSAVMASEMLKADAARIAARIGRPLTNGEIYVAHFLGPDDAERFLGSVVASPGSVAATLLPRPARANRPIFYAAGRRKPRGLSVAQVHQKFEEMMGSRTTRYQGVAGVTGLTAYAEATVR
jgi:hypothetical protein